MKIKENRNSFKMCNECKEDDAKDIVNVVISSFEIALCESCRNNLAKMILKDNEVRK